MYPMKPLFPFSKIACVFISAATLCAVTTVAQDLAQIETKINAVQKAVTDELSGKQEFIQAEADLLELFNQMIKKGEPAAGTKEAKVFEKIGALLVKARARMPEPYAGGAGQQSALPVPQFAENTLIGQVAQQLRKLQVELINQMREKPDSKRARDLLITVVIGQEDLAWEVGWPFTEEERKAIREAGGLSKEVYLSRRNRGLKQINEDLKADFEAVGRESSRQFSIFMPTAEDDLSTISERLTEKRGKAATDWREGTKPFDEALMKSLLQR